MLMTQLHIATCTANNDAKLSILADCTMDIETWYLLNGLLLSADKSELMLVGTAYQLQAASAIKSVYVAGRLIAACHQLNENT